MHNFDFEKTEVIRKLARKGNWGHKYDRLEHFKRFENIKEIVKDFSKKGWLLIYKKPKFIGIALNSQYKKEIKEYVENIRPELRGYIK